jgi:hypothetical protein
MKISMLIKELDVRNIIIVFSMLVSSVLMACGGGPTESVSDVVQQVPTVAAPTVAPPVVVPAQPVTPVTVDSPTTVPTSDVTDSDTVAGYYDNEEQICVVMD